MIMIDDRRAQVEEFLSNMMGKPHRFTEEEKEVLTNMLMDAWEVGRSVGRKEVIDEVEEALGPLVELLGWDVWSNKE